MFKRKKNLPEDSEPLPHPYPGVGDKLSGLRQRAGRRITLEHDDPHLDMMSLLPLGGIGLLIYAIVKYANAIIPVHLTNVSWELNTLSSVAENSITLFLAVVLIYSFKWGSIALWQLQLLYRGTYLLLVLAVVHLGLIPLGAINTLRVYDLMDQGYQRGVSMQERNWVKIQEVIENSRNMERLEIIATRLKLGAAYDTRQASFRQDSLIDRKTWLLTAAGKEYDFLRDQTRLNHEGELTEFYKMSLRTNGLLFLVGFLFLVLWFRTAWLRHLYASRGEIAGHLNELTDTEDKSVRH